MYHHRPRKENNECQTDLQCTPFILSENETANVHSSRLCQTEIHLSPRAPDTELYKIIPFIDEDDIERNAVRSVDITRNRKIKLQFVLPTRKTDGPPSLDDDNYTIADGLNEHEKDNENLQCSSNESFHKDDNQKQQSDEIDSVSSIGTLKSAIKKILREDDSTQTDLMIAPHILNEKERATITIHSSCQTSLTCSPRTSLTNVVPMLKSYWEHQGETREAFNKSENVLEILKEIIQDVINIHQHMFDPNYNLPDMNPALVKIGQKNSSMDSSEWDTVSHSRTTKKAIMDVSGDGSFENATLSELDSSLQNERRKDDNDFKQSAIASISTISEVTTLRSSDFTLASTKDDDYDDADVDDDDDDDDDDNDGVSDILDRLKKKYTSPNNEKSDNLSNVKVIHSEPVISGKTKHITVTKIKSTTNNSSRHESNNELCGSEVCSENDSKHSLHKDAVKDGLHTCQMINSNCVCSGIKIKLYLKDKFDSATESSARFIEMKIKPDLETIEIKKLLNISTDPELAEISSTIPFQEVENCLKGVTDDADSTEDLVKLFDIKDKQECIDADICKKDGLQIKINVPKKMALSPETTSEEFLQSFMLTNFLLEDLKKAPYPEILRKVSFPSHMNKDKTVKKLTCACGEKHQKPVSETMSPFTAVFSRLYEDPDNLIPFDANELFCGCPLGENEAVACGAEHEKFSESSDLDINSGICSLRNEKHALGKDQHFNHDVQHKKDNIMPLPNFSEENRKLKNMSSYVILPTRAVRQDYYTESYNDALLKKPGVFISDSSYDTNSITYDGHIYQTDSFFIQCGSDASDDSTHTHIIDKTMHNKSKKQTHTISYEEHMYKTDGDVVHHSNTTLTGEDCICALKLEESLKECPHCFKRIGPQYGRDQRGLNDDYDHPYATKDETDFCSTQQNATDGSKRELLSKTYLTSSSTRFHSNYTNFPSNQDFIDNLHSQNAIKFYTPERNTTENNDMTKRNNNTTSESDITKKLGSSNNLIETTSNITEIYNSRSGATKNVDSSNNMIEMTNSMAKNYTSGGDKTKNEDASNNLLQRTNNFAREYTSENDITKNADFYASEDTMKKNVYASKDSRENVDNTTKLKDTESNSKCKICYLDDTCPMILCEMADIIKHPLNHECSKSAVAKTSSLDKMNTEKDENYKATHKTSLDKMIANQADKYTTTGTNKCQTCSKAKLNKNLTSSLAKMIADKGEKYKATSKTKCPTCSKAKLNENPTMASLQDSSSLDKMIANMEEKYNATPKTKCQTCSIAKLNKNLTMALLQDTSSLDKMIADQKEKYNVTSKTKCQTCSKAKFNQTSNKNTDSAKNLKETNSNMTRKFDASEDKMKKNLYASKNSRENLDNTDDPTNYVEFIEKTYPRGKIVIGKMNSDHSAATKLTDAEPNSKCNICHLDGSCPMILCELADIIKHPLNHECSKSTVAKTSSLDEIIKEKKSLDKMIANKEDKYKTTGKTKCQTCSKAKLNKNRAMASLQDSSALDKMIANMEEKYNATSKTKCQTCSIAKLNKNLTAASLQDKMIANKEEKYNVTFKAECQTCSKAKLNKNLTAASLQDSSFLEKIIANKEEKYNATSKTKCQTCSKAKFNQKSNKNLTMVTIKEICSISSSKDELSQRIKNNAKIDKSYTCSGISNKANKKSETKLQEKRSIENVQKQTEIAEYQQNKKCLSCSNLVKDDLNISSTLIQSSHQDKSLTTPKAKCSTCKKSVNTDNTIQVIYPPKSKSSNYTCIKSKGRQTENMEQKSTQNSTKNKCSTCTANKPAQSICSQRIFSQVKEKLENLPEQQRKQNIAECPGPPYNSLRSNCKCSKCIFSKHLNEAGKSTYHTSSKCQQLPNSSIQRIFEKNLPCSCSSSSTNQEKEENSDVTIEYLTEKINQCFAKCKKQNKEDAPKNTTKITKDKAQENYLASDQIMSTSEFGSTYKYPTKFAVYQMGEEKMFNGQIENADLPSTSSITTQPKVRILDAPKYLYESSSTVSNSEFGLDTSDSKEIFLYTSLDNIDVGKYSVTNALSSSDEILFGSFSKSGKFESNESDASSKKNVSDSTKSTKTMKIHKLHGKHSVFSIEKHQETGESQTTIYILPNAIFSSLLSIRPPHFFRERTESEINDIINFSYVRNLYYEKNPEFDQLTNATAYTSCDSEELINIIADKNISNMNCTVACSCSLSVPKSQEQQTDEIIENLTVNASTSVTSLEDSENKAHKLLETNSVGIQSSFILFNMGEPQSEKTSFSTILKPSFDQTKILHDDNKNMLDDTSQIIEPNAFKIMGKYITWKDLVSPNMCNPISVQNAITSLEPINHYANQKVDRSIQTSLMSSLTTLPEPSTVPPLTIEASTSTRNLEMETSVISTSRYHLSENLSKIDVPVHYPTISDSSISMENNNIRKNIFQAPLAAKFLQKNVSPILTLEASTSTTSRNQATVQTADAFTSELPDTSIFLSDISPPGKNLIEEETSSISNYQTFAKTSTSKLPISKTTSSISLAKNNSPYKHRDLGTSSLVPKSRIPLLIKNEKVSTVEVKDNIEFSSKSPPLINSTLKELSGTFIEPLGTSTNDMFPSISLANISMREEPNLAKLHRYSEIPLSKDQISCLSLPKVESLCSIPDSNDVPTDAGIINLNKYDLNNQEWSYSKEKEKLSNLRKFIYKTSSPLELVTHSKEDVSISGNLKHDDTSVSKKISSIQNQTLLKSKLVEENNEESENKTNFSSSFYHPTISGSNNSADVKLKDEDETNITISKWNTSSTSPTYSGSSKFTSKLNNKYSTSSKTSDEDQYNKFNTYDKYRNLENTELNKESKYSPLIASTSKDVQKDAGNIAPEHIHKNVQLENLLSRAMDAYTAYLTLKKGISASLNVSKMDLPYQQFSSNLNAETTDSECTEENRNDYFKEDLPTQHGSKDFYTDSLTSKSDDYYSDYLKRKERISSLISMAKMDSPFSNLEYIKERGRNAQKLSDTNIDSHNLRSSKELKTDDFLSKTERAYTKLLQRKEKLSPNISVLNIYSTFEQVPKDLQTPKNTAKNSSNYRYSPHSGASTTISFKEDSLTSKNKEQDAEVSPLPSILKKDPSYQESSSKPNFYADLRSDKFILSNDDNNDASSKGEEEISILNKDIYRGLRSDKFYFKKDDDNGVSSKFEGELSITNRESHSSTDKNIKTEKKDTYNIDSEYSEILKRKQIELPSISGNTNQSLYSLKNEDSFLRRLKEEEKELSLPTVNDLASNSISLEESNYPDIRLNKFTLKNDETITNKEENETSLLKTNSPYQYSNTSRPNTSKELKSDKFIFHTRDDYTAYLMREEEISEKLSARKATTSYLQPISRNRSSKDLKSNAYSTYLTNEETASPRRSTSKIASSYPYTENRNSREIKSNKFVLKPASRERVSSPINLLNNNSANNKNSATSKLSSFVRNGATSALLSNIGDSPQQLSVATIDYILPDIAASSHRVLEAVQSCEQRLQPIKSALKDIKMKLKELNMPEVNDIFQDDPSIDENNKTYIYLPKPPPPLVSNRCSYRTRMTFQLKKPIKPLSVTANVNPFSIKHKYILNDADNNHSILNTNYSSVSDPPYYMQQTSMNSINPNFNQSTPLENKPMRPKRYHPDTYYERSHNTRKPAEVIEEDLPFSPEDLEGRKAMDEFQQHHYTPNNYEMYYYQPRTESLNNYVVFPPIVKSNRVYVPITNSFNKTEHVHNKLNAQNNMKMFTGDYPIRRNKPKK